MPRIWASTAAYPFALFALSTDVSAQNVDEMAKWTALTVVHYRVVGEHSDETGPFGGFTPVGATDRVEIEFDWDQFEMKLAGPAKITNSPTRSPAPVGLPGCPAPRVDGALEVLTAVSISEQIPGMLTIATTSSSPAGSYSGPSEQGPCGNRYEVAAKSESDSITLQVVPAMMLAMGPPGTEPISQDGKSLVVKSGNWTWTFTPTPVR
jgi:hypothetical protein